MTPTIPEKKPTSVFSWLGFGISLTVFVLIWAVNIFAITQEGKAAILPGLYMVLFLAGGFLGFLGLVLSIVGLVMAIRNFTSKWMSVSGIILSCVSVISYIAVPMLASTIVQKEPVKIQLPESVVEEKAFEPNVVLYASKDNLLTCYDNSNGEDDDPIIFDLSNPQFSDLFSTWIKQNGIDNQTPVAIKTDSETPYDNIILLLDEMQKNDMKKFKLMTSLKESK